MADGEEEGEEGEEGEGEEGEKRLVDLRRSSLMASPQVKTGIVRDGWDGKRQAASLLTYVHGE